MANNAFTYDETKAVSGSGDVVWTANDSHNSFIMNANGRSRQLVFCRCSDDAGRVVGDVGFVNGNIDDVRLYDHALDSNAVYRLASGLVSTATVSITHPAPIVNLSLGTANCFL